MPIKLHLPNLFRRPQMPRFNKRVIFTFFSATFIIGGTILAIQYAKGGRPTTSGEIRETGLLVANSFPTGAQVYINGKLVTATDDTLNLDPGDYQVEIKKDGFSTWSKKVLVEKELVRQTNTLLFPTVPSLSPITFTGVENMTPAPDGQKLLYYTASASATTNNGLYLVDLTDNPLSLQRGPRQVVQETEVMDLGKADILWSPDSSEFILSDGNQAYLIDSTKTTALEGQRDISFQISRILSEWEEEMYLRERQILSKFPEEIIQIATQSATNVYFSPDQERLLYTATETFTLPENIIPAVPAANNQPQVRNLIPGGMYVYDRKEDKNFQIGTNPELFSQVTKQLLATDLADTPLTLVSSPSAFRRLQATESGQTAQNFRAYHSGLFTQKYQWYPNSRHLIRIQPDSISVVEYDGTNQIIVYSGPFESGFAYPWSDGDKLLITTSFNQLPNAVKNLYAIELK